MSLTINPSYSITGKVTDSNSNPRNAITLSLTGTASKSTTTDLYGNYIFSNLINGNYTLTPSSTGYTFTPANKTVTISGANNSGVDFSMPVYYLKGKVTTSNGSGLVLTNVTLSGTGVNKTIGTGSTGEFIFDVANGTYTLTPKKTGYTFSPSNRTVTVSGGTLTGLNFTATTQ